jgi:hypothetical protein
MRLITFTAIALACLPALHAEEPLQVPWNEVCKTTVGKEMNIKTAAGGEINGYCVSVSIDEMNVRTQDGKIVKLARSALQGIRMRRTKSHQLSALRKGMHGSLHESVDLLFSPLAPLGIVAVPGTIAWGIVATPFCALSDLHDKLQGSREIRLM